MPLDFPGVERTDAALMIDVPEGCIRRGCDCRRAVGRHEDLRGARLQFLHQRSLAVRLEAPLDLVDERDRCWALVLLCDRESRKSPCSRTPARQRKLRRSPSFAVSPISAVIAKPWLPVIARSSPLGKDFSRTRHRVPAADPWPPDVSSSLTLLFASSVVRRDRRPLSESRRSNAEPCTRRRSRSLRSSPPSLTRPTVRRRPTVRHVPGPIRLDDLIHQLEILRPAHPQLVNRVLASRYHHLRLGTTASVPFHAQGQAGFACWLIGTRPEWPSQLQWRSPHPPFGGSTPYPRSLWRLSD